MRRTPADGRADRNRRLAGNLVGSVAGFGNVPQSTPSASKNITLSNAEAVPLTISTITTGNPDFAETDTCDGGVPAKSQCTITIMFTPRLIGVETGTLTVTDAASNSPQTATLTGTGIAQAAVSPASLTFAALKVGSTSAAKNVTLTNNLSTALTISQRCLHRRRSGRLCRVGEYLRRELGGEFQMYNFRHIHAGSDRHSDGNHGRHG